MAKKPVGRERNYVVVVFETVAVLIAEVMSEAFRWAGQAAREAPEVQRPTVGPCYSERDLTLVRFKRERISMDFIVSGDPTPYQERTNAIPTQRRPSPRLNMDANPVHAYPMATPNPDPSLLHPYRKPSAPDAGLVTPWPVPGQ